MSTHIRTFNLKKFGMMIFISLFLLGGFFINTTKSEASSTIKSFGVTYTLSSPLSTTNADGSTSTKVFVGCAPKSGDLFDINTGVPCNNTVQTTIVACVPGSGHIYDVNTGIPCASYIKSVIIGCAPNSGDVYDTNTGNKCTNSAPKVIARIIPKQILTPNDLVLTPTITATNSQDTTLNATTTDSNLSGRESLMNGLAATAVNASNIVKGPMSFWIVLLILAILLAGGFGVYSFLKLNKKEGIKQPTAKPVTPITHTTTTPATPVTPNTTTHTTTTPNTPVTPVQAPLYTNTKTSNGTAAEPVVTNKPSNPNQQK